MVSAGARHLLTSMLSDPLLVSKVCGCSEDECWEYLNDYNRALQEADDMRDELGIKQSVKNWIDSEPDKNNLRIEAIKEQLQDAKQNPQAHDVGRLLLEVKILTGKAERPTAEMIARAKQHPIGRLLNTEGRKGNVSCPFHKDKTPSFQIKKNNTFTCYSCGVYGDPIDLYQKMKNVSFIEAVKNLI